MKVSVVIVNWNGRELLRRNLPHVLAMTGPAYEVIVVDNGSSDGSAHVVREEFPRVRLVALAENRGFAGGNNAALPFARGEFLATLNNDARPESDWLERLVDGARPEGVGICASKLIVEGQGVIDSAGDEYRTTLDAGNRGGLQPAARFDEGGEVFGACAGAALFRRKMLDEIGFFDEDFFLVYEDVDLSFRARMAGWGVVYVPGAVVHHARSASLDRVPDLHAYCRYRNEEFVWIKNLPARLTVRYAAGAALHRMIEALEAWRRMRGRFGVYLRAKRDVLASLPRLLGRRRKIQGRRKSTVDQIERVLTAVPTLTISHWREQVRRALRW